MKIVTLGQYEPSVCAIGFFDGFHQGHQKLLAEVKKIARQQNLKMGLITFSYDPYIILTKKSKQHIMTLKEKVTYLQGQNLDYLFLLDTTESLLQLTPTQFVDEFIRRNNIKHIVCGFDFRFGHQGKGDANFLRSLSDLATTVIEPYLITQQKVSSTRIIQQLQAGNIEEVNHLLGFTYSMQGRVIQGKARGRKLGYPTANLAIDSDKLLPPDGVYAGYVNYDNQLYPAMTSIGMNPTFNDITTRQVETHIIGLNVSLYREIITFAFLSRLRDEIKFNSVDDLINQLTKDALMSRQLFDKYLKNS